MSDSNVVDKEYYQIYSLMYLCESIYGSDILPDTESERISDTYVSYKEKWQKIKQDVVKYLNTLDDAGHINKTIIQSIIRLVTSLDDEALLFYDTVFEGDTTKTQNKVKMRKLRVRIYDLTYMCESAYGSDILPNINPYKDTTGVINDNYISYKKKWQERKKEVLDFLTIKVKHSNDGIESEVLDTLINLVTSLDIEEPEQQVLEMRRVDQKQKNNWSPFQDDGYVI